MADSMPVDVMVILFVISTHFKKERSMGINTKYQETWFEALLNAIAVLWFIMGAAAPAPALPLVLGPQFGWPLAIFLALVSTAIWLGVPYGLFKWTELIQDARLGYNVDRKLALDLWLNITVYNAVIASVCTALLHFPGAILSLVIGIYLGIRAWRKNNKWATLVSVAISIITILFWDAVSTSGSYGPILWFLHGK